MMDETFEMILDSDENLEFTIRCTMLEIYNEKIKDLLDSKQDNLIKIESKINLQIREDKAHGIYVAGATETYVNSPEEMKQVMKSGSVNRTVASTRMNAVSSRSHLIFCMKVNKKNVQTEEVTESRLYFIDLAGSEKMSKTNVKGKQLNEAKNINKSLTNLGLVIKALVESNNTLLFRLLTHQNQNSSPTEIQNSQEFCRRVLEVTL